MENPMEASNENKAPTLAAEEVANMIDSPLFAQIASMMVVCQSAKNLVDAVVEADTAGTVGSEETAKLLNSLMAVMASQLTAVDFEHGSEIMAGALDACRMVQP
jgi:hypothetical protein